MHSGRSRAGRAFLAAVAACVVASRGVAADPPADGIAPWSGVLPGEDREDAVAVQVLDAETGRPRPGVLVRWYPEDCGARAVRYDVLLAQGKADENGIAVLPFEPNRKEGHWVTANGGFAHEFGVRPPARMEVARGRPFVGRVRDAFGKPVKDATVDLFLGCGHGPTVATARTDEAGLFTFSDVPASDGRFWIVAAGCVATPVLPWDGYLGARPTEFVLEPGVVLRGTALDPAGRPLAGVVVRQYEEPRGPVTVTNERGEFTLAGASPEAKVTLLHPAGTEPVDVPRWDPGRALRVKVSAVRPDLPAADATVLVTLADPDGKPVVGETVALVGEDGVVYEGETGIPDEVEQGAKAAGPAARVRVPAGKYRLEPLDAFSPFDFEEAAVSVDSGDTVAVIASGTLRPRLVVEGAGEGVVDAWAGGSRAAASDSLRVDAHVPAVVRLGRSWAVVGPVEEGGVRRAFLRPPALHRVRWPAELKVGSVELLHDGLAVRSEIDGASLVTAAGGNLVLRLVLQEPAKTLDVPVRLPVEDGAPFEAVVDPLRDGTPLAAGDIRLRVLLADGSPPRGLGVKATDGRENYELRRFGPDPEPVVLRFLRAVVRIETDGHAPLVVRVDAPGEREVRWGPTRLGLTVLDEDGQPTEAVVMLDGETYRDEHGHFDLAGISAGPHLALVKSPGTDAPGLSWRFTVAEGTTTVEQSLKLPPVR